MTKVELYTDSLADLFCVEQGLCAARVGISPWGEGRTVDAHPMTETD